MPNVTEWWVFLATAALVAVAPGPGILYVLARSLHGGRRAGLRSSLGNFLGASVHVLAATVGLSALLAASAVAFTVVKLLGAAYLLYLGVRTLWEVRVGTPAQEPESPTRRFRSAVVQGFFAEMLNPKTAMFFLAFLPQFVHPESGTQSMAFCALGLVFVMCTLTADLLVAFFAGSLGNWLASNRHWRRRLHAISGTTLIGLGGTLALSERW